MVHVSYEIPLLYIFTGKYTGLKINIAKRYVAVVSVCSVILTVGTNKICKRRRIKRRKKQRKKTSQYTHTHKKKKKKKKAIQNRQQSAFGKVWRAGKMYFALVHDHGPTN